MTVQDRAVTIGVRAGVWCLRLGMLHLPEAINALIFRGLARLIWVFTGDPEAAKPIREVADIFVSGPPHTTRLRRLFENMEPNFIAGAARCLARRSPYGEP